MNDPIENLLADSIASGDFPSAAYLVSRGGEVVLRGAVGNGVVEPETIAADPLTVYDVASLTKVLVTGLLAAILVERKELDLAGRAPGLHCSVSDLAAHTSGLPAWLPLYLLVGDPGEANELIRSKLTPVGARDVVYSDLNFILLADEVVRRLVCPSLDVAARTLIVEPLQLANTTFRPPAELRPRIAASEIGSNFEREMCISGGYISGEEARQHPAFRSGVIWGEVHDGNAWFLGGAAGHAGLFSTVDDIHEVAKQFLAGSTSLLRPETCELFSENLTPGMSEDRSFAFQLASTAGSTAGPALSQVSFGHTGFTGTSLWIDPENESIYVLLTNRTHAHGLPLANINDVRRRFHTAAAAFLQENR